MLELWSGHRVKRRTFVVTGLAIAACLAVAGLIALLAVAQIGPDNLIRFNITDPADRNRVFGNGIDLSAIDDGNLIQDGSFEPIVFRQTLTTYDGDASTLTVSAEEAAAGQYGDGFFNGALIRVLGQTADGLQLKKTATVEQYGLNRLSVLQNIRLPADLPAESVIHDLYHTDEITLACGSHGLVLRIKDDSAVRLADPDLKGELTGICASAQGMLVCSDQGELAFSADGQSWQTWVTTRSTPLRDVGVIQLNPGDPDSSQYVAVGDQGTILCGQKGLLLPAAVPLRTDLLTVSASENGWYASGREGALLESKAGVVWESAAPDTAAADWLAMSCSGDLVVAVGESGRIAIRKQSGKFSLIDTSDIQISVSEPAQDGQDKGPILLQEQTLVDVVLLSDQQMIILEQSGRYLVTNDGGVSWLPSSMQPGIQSQMIISAGKDRILSADTAGRLALANLVAEIRIDSPLTEGTFQAGDLIYLEKTVAEIPANYQYRPIQDSAVPVQTDSADPDADADETVSLPITPADAQNNLTTDQQLAKRTMPWSLYGEASVVRLQNEAAGNGGTGCLQISSASKLDSHFISQQLSREDFQKSKGNAIYQLEFWLKQEDLAEREVMAWLSGPATPIGTTFINVANGWKKYTFAFILPSSWVNIDSEIRLNIGFSGPGTIWLDRVSLKDATDSVTEWPDQIVESLQDAQPGVLRLAFVPIGSAHAVTEAWAWPQGNDSVYIDTEGSWQTSTGSSLFAALTACADLQADPWLIVDSQASEDEINHLIEYLVGPVSSTYGRLRLEQGSTMLWTDSFNRLYLEIRDTAGVLTSDQLRADYVDWILRTVMDSPYYLKIKNQLVFLDGMPYQDGVMLSSADYHTSDLQVDASLDTLESLDSAYMAYFAQTPRNPVSQMQNGTELIRSISLSESVNRHTTLALWTELLLQDLGKQTHLSCLTLGLSGDYKAVDQALFQQQAAATKIASASNNASALAIDHLVPATTETTGTAVIKSAAVLESGDYTAAATDPGPNLLIAHAYRADSTIRIVLINLDSKLLTCQLSTELALARATLTKYDSAGHLLGQSSLRHSSSRITILPGGVVVIEK